MKRIELVNSLQKEVLEQSPRVQAIAINQLDPTFIPATVKFLLDNNQDAFLRFLSLKALIVVVRYYFTLSEDLFFIKNDDDSERDDPAKVIPTETHNRFLKIIKLPKFPQVWSKVCHDTPCAAFSLIPIKLMRPVVRKNLSKIIPAKDHSKLFDILQQGTYALKMLSHGLCNQENIPAYRSDVRRYQQKLKSLGNVENNDWLDRLLKVMPVSYKLQLLYGKGASDIDFERTTYCVAQHYHISDERSDPTPFALAFLTFHPDMASPEYKYDQRVEDSIDIATDEFIVKFIPFAVKLDANKRVADLIDFFNFIAHTGRVRLVRSLSTEIIAQLFKQNRCLWMKENLSENQRIALGSKGSVSATDVSNAIFEVGETPLLTKTVQKARQLSLKEKFQVVVSTANL